MSKDSNLADLGENPNDADFENELINELESSNKFVESADSNSAESSDFSQRQKSKEAREFFKSSETNDFSDFVDSSDSGDDEEENPSEFQTQINEWKDKYLRAHADFENVKKRLEREKNQALEYAYEKIAKDLLPIVDTLERAKEAAKEHSAILEGINLTQENLLKTLQKHGIEEISTSGEFDPNLHECIMQVQNAELNDGDIAQVLQKGYTYKERTLRPAMVALVKN
ncbi:nucleotide exchange factor GrpE [Helicobacter sp. T3_23-1056]